MRPWAQGRFAEAEQEFARMKDTLPQMPQLLLWEADFNIERARFGVAASLINEAKRIGTPDTADLADKRLARLFLCIGRFAEAQKIAMGGRQWDGRDIRRLKVSSAAHLVTLGEVFLARGSFLQALTILEKARDRAKNVSSLDGLEWIRAQNDIAVANLGLGSVQAASQVVSLALSEAEREWGAGSLPAVDTLDATGCVRLAESKFQAAEVLFSRSRASRAALYGAEHPKLADSYMHAALLSAAQRDYAGAVRLADRSLEIEEVFTVGPNGRLALALLSEAEILAKAGQLGEAKTCYERAIPVLERELGTDAPRLESSRRRLADLSGK